MVVVRADYDVLTAHQTVIDMIESSLSNEMAQVDFDRIFMVKDTQNRRTTEKLTHGISGITKVWENQDYPEVSGEEGTSISWTQGKYGADLIVTEDVRLYDEYDILNDEIDSLSEDMKNKIQKAHYDVLNNGWSTSYSNVFTETVTAIWPDGLPLFSSVHHKHTGVGAGGGTFSNIITDGTYTNPVPSFTALDKARQTGLLFTDTHNVQRPINFDTVICWPDLETLFQRIINSDQMYGTGNNDINPLKGRFKIIVSPYIGTGKWFVADSNKVGKTLKSHFRTRPMVKPPKEFEPNDNWHYVFKTRFAYGFSYSPYILGSKGDNS